MAVRAILRKKLNFMNELSFLFINYTLFNPRAPVAQKVADEVVFRRFRGEGVEFFYRTSLTPIRFLMRIFWKIPI